MKYKILKFILNILNKNTACPFFNKCIKPSKCKYRFCWLIKLYTLISSTINEVDKNSVERVCMKESKNG